MEAPGSITLLYIMFTLPRQAGINHPLPLANWTMAGMFVRNIIPHVQATPKKCLSLTLFLSLQTIHYIYRAILAPLVLNPSMSPIHPLVWLSALGFQLVNAISIGGWLAGYGPTSVVDWAGRYAWIQIGMTIWAAGLLGNIYHDDDLREIRRAALRTQKRRAESQDGPDKKGKAVDKVYMMPENGLFRVILYPHYVCEWIEWAGFWMMGGRRCTPARTFLLNEIATMAPRALQGRKWYLNRFGREKVGRRKALIPGLI